jgi:hypothetical protein
MAPVRSSIVFRLTFRLREHHIELSHPAQLVENVGELFPGAVGIGISDANIGARLEGGGWRSDLTRIASLEIATSGKAVIPPIQPRPPEYNY